jgi:hypothetical protein
VFLTVLQKSLLLSHQARTGLVLEIGLALHVVSLTSSVEQPASDARSQLWVVVQLLKWVVVTAVVVVMVMVHQQ